MTASDPTELIREADEALAQEAANEGGPIVDDPTTLVRRLRDALEATAGDACGTCLAIAREARKDASLFENLYDEARAALAEAKTTIEARDDALMRAGRDNLRLHRIVEQVRALHVPNDGACDDGCCTVCDECDRSWPCDTKRAVDGAPDPRRVETAEELATFPNRTVFMDSDACAGIVSVRPNEYHPDKPSIGVRFADSSEYHDGSIDLDVKYPVRILWLPEVSS